MKFEREKKDEDRGTIYSLRRDNSFLNPNFSKKNMQLSYLRGKKHKHQTQLRFSNHT